MEGYQRQGGAGLLKQFTPHEIEKELRHPGLLNDCVRAPGEVEGELIALRSEINVLESLANELESRLLDVLADDVPPPECPRNPEVCIDARLSVAIRNERFRLDFINTKVRSLIQRCRL